MIGSKIGDSQRAYNFAGARYCQVYPRSHLMYYR